MYHYARGQMVYTLNGKFLGYYDGPFTEEMFYVSDKLVGGKRKLVLASIARP